MQDDGDKKGLNRRQLLGTSAAVAGVAARTPGLTIRRGVRVAGLVTAGRSAVPRVVGVRTDVGEVTADLVVDATGRHGPTVDWIVAAGGRAPAVTEADRASSGATLASGESCMGDLLWRAAGAVPDPTGRRAGPRWGAPSGAPRRHRPPAGGPRVGRTSTASQSSACASAIRPWRARAPRRRCPPRPSGPAAPDPAPPRP